jgi:hypothetical protein
MALYFIKEEKSSTPDPSKTGTNHSVRRLLLILGILAILIAGVIQASGLLLAWESRLPALLSLPSPKVAPTIFIPLSALANSSEADSNSDMDTTLVLRGLSMLHPSLVLLASQVPSSSDAELLLGGVKMQLRDKGIALIEGMAPDSLNRWHPVPLCRYLLPRPLASKESLPLIAGSAPPEGTLRSLPSATKESPAASLALLSATSNGEIVGSLWWEGLLHAQPNAPVWLLADRLLLLPNHAALPCSQGNLALPRNMPVVPTVASEDFILKMEEHERGSANPDFDSLWQNALVVIGPPSLQPLVAAMTALRSMTAWAAFTLIAQLAIVVTLLILVSFTLLLPQKSALLLTIVLLLGGILGSWWSFHHGILPPILPWIIALVISTAAILSRRVAR